MTLDDSVLRGFCSKCGAGVFYDEKYQYQFNSTVRLSEACMECVPVWFLNAKQIKVVYDSDEYLKWCIEQRKKDNSINTKNLETMKRFLEEEPFLIAKILKENDKK